MKLKYLSTCMVSCLLFLQSTSSYAHSKVVVPLGDSAEAMQNIIRVSPGNGDFSSVHLAMESITDASANNPYVVVVGPGVYQESSRIDVPSYVNLIGSGINRTIIEGQRSSISEAFAGLIILSGNSQLSGMTIRNDSNSTYTAGVGNPGSQVSIKDVSIWVSGGTQGNYGITNSSFSSFDVEVEIQNVDILLTGGDSRCWGIYNQMTAARIDQSEIIVRCGSAGSGIGIRINDARDDNPSVIRNSSVLVRQANINTGILVDNTRVRVVGSDIEAQQIFSDETAYGLRNLDSDS